MIISELQFLGFNYSPKTEGNYIYMRFSAAVVLTTDRSSPTAGIMYNSGTMLYTMGLLTNRCCCDPWAVAGLWALAQPDLKPGLSGFEAAAQLPEHRETALSITDRLCCWQALILIKGARFLAPLSSLSFHWIFLLIHLSSVRILSSYGVFFSPSWHLSAHRAWQGQSRAHHTILCHIWSNTSAEVDGDIARICTKTESNFREESTRGTFSGTN